MLFHILLRHEVSFQLFIIFTNGFGRIYLIKTEVINGNAFKNLVVFLNNYFLVNHANILFGEEVSVAYHQLQWFFSDVIREVYHNAIFLSFRNDCLNFSSDEELYGAESGNVIVGECIVELFLVWPIFNKDLSVLKLHTKSIVLEQSVFKINVMWRLKLLFNLLKEFNHWCFSTELLNCKIFEILIRFWVYWPVLISLLIFLISH